MEKKKKIILYVSIIIFIILLVVSATYAWFFWRTTDEEKININVDIGDATVTFDGGSNIRGILKPVYDKEDGIKKTITVSSDLPDTNFNLYLKLNTLPSELNDESFWWAIYRNDEGWDSDVFKYYYEGDEITLVYDEPITYPEGDTYTLYLWIDANMDNDYTMGGKEIDFDLYATGSDSNLNEIS